MLPRTPGCSSSLLLLMPRQLCQCPLYTAKSNEIHHWSHLPGVGSFLCRILHDSKGLDDCCVSWGVDVNNLRSICGNYFLVCFQTCLICSSRKANNSVFLLSSLKNCCQFDGTFVDALTLLRGGSRICF